MPNQLASIFLLHYCRFNAMYTLTWHSVKNACGLNVPAAHENKTAFKKEP
jgi:hypothetical protein